MVGEYSKTIFQGSNGYCVYVYNGPQKSFTAVGYNLPQNGRFVFDGNWEMNKYGEQLKVSSFKEMLPTKCEDIILFLVKGNYKGVKGKNAKKLVEAFGEQTIEYIDKYPDKVINILGEKKGEAFLTDWNSKRALQRLFPIIEKYKLDSSAPRKIINLFGQNAYDILSADPYRLCEIDGIPFPKIDSVEKADSNFDPTKESRIEQGIIYILEQNEMRGNLYIKADELLNNLFELLYVDKEYLKYAINDYTRKKKLCCQCGVVYRREAFEAEYNAAIKLSKLLQEKRSFDKTRVHQLIDCLETLDETQKSAVYTALTNSVSIITGGPGRGKTTIIRAIIECFKELNPNGIIELAAPTGKAASRMSESCKHKAQTMHSLLGITPDSTDGARMIDANLIIIDEISMCDQFLFEVFLDNVKPHTVLVFVGDSNQLPSVSAGDVLVEMINSKKIPVTVLSKVYRQSEGNGIFINSKLVEQGDSNLVYNEDFTLIPCYSANDVHEQLKALGNTPNSQVLSPLRKDPEIGTKALNLLLQDVCNKRTSGFKCRGIVWRVGDRVMNLKNTDELANGDSGVVTKVFYDSITVLFESGTEKTYTKSEIEDGDLDLAYALTVHKMQGGEIDTVILVFTPKVSRMRQKKLFYTAITRAKKKVIILGDTGSIDVAVSNKYLDVKRNTLFGARIQKYSA